MNRTFLFYFLVLITTLGAAQEKESENENFKPHHSISLLLGHTYLSEGNVEGEKKWLTLPSIGFDYNYVFSKKWSIGLHNDIVIENFKVEDDKNEVIERTKPFASLLTTGYKPGKHFTFQLGFGGEFAKEENLFVTRIGVEYSLELPGEWEFLTNFSYDNKWKTYDSFCLSVGIAKSFGR